MPVPLLDIRAQNQVIEAQAQEVFLQVFRSSRFILGPEGEALEREIAELCRVPHALAVSSGTDALLLAFMALGIGPGDEVLCPAFTFFATAGCIARLGAVPVWVDVREEDFNIDCEDAAAKVTERTRAIVAVHLFGQMADMPAVLALAEQHGLAVVEDAAQAIGSAFDGRPAGSWGDVGTLSFYPTKNLGAFGDAGMVVSRRDDLSERMRKLRNHGMHPKYYHGEIGGNFRLDTLQSALLRLKLPLLAGYASARREHAEAYQVQLGDQSGLHLPVALPGRQHVWNQFTLRLPGRRDAVKAALDARQIGNEVYYPLSLDEQPCFAGKAGGEGTVPVARRLAREVLSIPVFPEMTVAQRDEVISVLKEVLACE